MLSILNSIGRYFILFFLSAQNVSLYISRDIWNSWRYSSINRATFHKIFFNLLTIQTLDNDFRDLRYTIINRATNFQTFELHKFKVYFLSVHGLSYKFKLQERKKMIK